MTGLILKAQCICDVCMRRIEFQIWIYDRRITGILIGKIFVNSSYTSNKEEIEYSHQRNWMVHRYTTCLPTANSHAHYTHLYATRPNTHTPRPNTPSPRRREPRWVYELGMGAWCVSELYQRASYALVYHPFLRVQISDLVKKTCLHCSFFSPRLNWHYSGITFTSPSIVS